MRSASFIMSLLVVLVTVSGALADLGDGLVTYYNFNGNADDLGTNGNDAVVLGATPTEDMYGAGGGAYYFDGLNDYILASANNLPTAERTVSLWFKTDTVTNKPNLIAYGGTGFPGTSWLMGIDHWGHSTMGVTSHWNNNTLEYSYGSAPIDDWFNFVITTDPTGTRIYLDGAVKSSNTNFINNTHVTDKDLSIGVAVNTVGYAPYVDGNVGYFKGIMDDVRIYDRALSAPEVQELHAMGAEPIPIPTPSAFILGGIGLGMVGAYTRKRRQANVTEV